MTPCTDLDRGPARRSAVSRVMVGGGRLRGALKAMLGGVLALALAACGGDATDDGGQASAAGERRDAGAWNAADLIPRALLFGDPQRARGRLSPDGTQLAWLEPADGVLNVWTAPVEHPEDVRLLTDARDVGVYEFDWLRNNTHIVYSLGRGGSDPTRVYAVDVITGEIDSLTSGGDVRSSLAAVSWDYPDEVVIAVDDREPGVSDLHRVNVVTGESERIFANEERFTRLHLDRALRLRVATRENAQGDREIFNQLPDGAWRRTGVTPVEDAEATGFVGFDGSNAAGFSLDSRGRDATALTRFDFVSGETTALAETDGVDITGVLLHPTTYEADAVLVDGLSVEWIPLNTRAANAIRVLDRALDSSYNIFSRTVDDRLWVIFERGPTNPGVYHLFNRETEEIERLMDVRPDIASHRLAPMTPVVITTRDGLAMPSFLTLPGGADADGDGVPERASPLVIIPEVGPQRPVSYDHTPDYDYNPMHQWLADRGYAALTVNARGAVGFGKAFKTAGDGDGMDAVQQDLRDVVAWAIDNGVADPDRVGVFGFWLGGQVSLTAAAQPDTPFACGGAYHAPSDLVGLAEDLPVSWAGSASFVRRRLGDPQDPAIRERLAARSPIHLAPSFRIPVFFAHGGLDAGLQHGLAREAAQRALDAGVAVTYLGLAEDAGLLQSPWDRQALFAGLEAFLADCLGGRLEPVADDLAGARFDAVVGVANTPALAAVLTDTDDAEMEPQR